MKKFIVMLIAPLILASLAFAEPTRTDSSQGGSSSSTGSSGGIVVGTVADQSTYTVTGGMLFVMNPMFNPEITYNSPATASEVAYKNLVVSTTTLVAGVTTYTLAKGDYTDIITPRNIVIVSSAAAGGSTTGSALVTGLDQFGNVQTETITVSTIAANCAGSKAWSTVTSVAITMTAINNVAVNIHIGSGVKIGVPADINKNAEILKVIEDKALSTTYTYDKTYNTITFASAPDSTKIYQLYLCPKMR